MILPVSTKSIPSIRVENLTRQYGGLSAIKNISFTINQGEVVGFLGPNGAGKSTTMRILSGIMPATSGYAWVNGVSVAQEPQRVKHKIGYMPENNPLPNHLRVIEYLKFRARLKGVRGSDLRATVQKAMETCDLARTARRKIIGSLSKGFRQRVGIADALLGNPEVILMDEPTIGLDPHQIQGIRKLINQLRGRMTVVLSSHILPEIERCCDRVVIINRGRVVAIGTSRELQQEFLPGNRFDLEIEGSENEVIELLKAKGLRTEILDKQDKQDKSEKRLSMTLRVDGDGNGELAPELILALSTSPGLKLHSLVPRIPNLEEIFLAATKRSWEETIDTPRAKTVKTTLNT